ncbi:nuclear transport factor 2 family protein [Rhodococcus sp. NPDC127530]|uniref:nuclear transport factor 2 family protein n=1 Tax=unclassified Rhodococcus (in: high G+C Gram-positive bacteria) TaxID=192944 RepID=UPI00363B0EF7
MSESEQTDGPDALDLADEAAIVRLYQEYNHSIDRGDAELWASTWSENGVFEHPTRTYRGHDELAAFVRNRTAASRSHPVTDQQHWNADLRLVSDGTHVAGSCRLLVSARDRESGTAVVVTTGSYSDIVTRVQDRWIFVQRSLVVD